MELQGGTCYLLEAAKPEVAFRVLRLQERAGRPCLCITREYPDRVRARLALRSSRLYWLADAPGTDRLNPKAIAGLAKLIEDFVQANPGGAVVLLDGLEYLIHGNGFDHVLTLVEHLNEFVMTRNAVLLLPVSPKALERQQLALLERFVEVPDVESWKAELDARDWSGRLGGTGAPRS